jgi:hypothetical protein
LAHEQKDGGNALMRDRYENSKRNQSRGMSHEEFEFLPQPSAL